MRLNCKQRGDTLIEVTIALTILSAVLAGSFNLANRAFLVGVSARERTQASNLAQEQAEGIRNYRDNNAASWPLPSLPPVGAAFHMDRSPGWRILNGPVTLDSLFDVSITHRPVPAETNLERFTVVVSWQPAGGGPLNTSTIITDLANLNP